MGMTVPIRLGSVFTSRNVLGISLALLPFVSVYAAKGMVGLLMVTALALMGDPEVRRAVVQGRWRWPMATFLPLLLYGLITAPWAVEPDHSALLVVRLAILVGAATVLWRASEVLTAEDRRFLHLIAAVAGIALLMLVAVELASDLAIMRWLKNLKKGPGANDYLTYINSGISMLALFCPVAALGLARRFGVVAASLYVALALMTVFFGNATTPMMGMLLAIGFAPLAFVFGRGVIRLIGIALVVGTLAMPFAIDRFLQERGGLAGVEDAIGWSSVHRLIIWTFALERHHEKPLVGWGLDASREIPGGHQAIPGYATAELMPLHPHNGALQAWLELGALGVLSVMFLYWRVAEKARTLGGDRLFAVAASSLLIGYGTQGMLSFGLWQNWWLSSLAIAAFLLNVARKP